MISYYLTAGDDDDEDSDEDSNKENDADVEENKEEENDPFADDVCSLLSHIPRL